MTPDQMSHWIVQLNGLNRFLCLFPLPKEYREQTTYREFNAVVEAKEVELGLTEDVYRDLLSMRDDPEVSWAFTEIGMTKDNREMLVPSYFEDFPLNYYWMPQYKPVRKAVDDYISSKGLYVGSSDEEVAEVVRAFLLENPITPSR
ncbi:MAG: hypothetical protein EON58_13075 [Alphaproteobacteria bacterium]|nr:MAG: hypothetical protein EON58_13075 [Alphaproteobacteria bacterium]